MFEEADFQHLAMTLLQLHLEVGRQGRAAAAAAAEVARLTPPPPPEPEAEDPPPS
jgi:hypothetical protein